MSFESDLQQISLEIDHQSSNKRLLIVLPESAGDIFLATSLFKSLKELYSDYDFYFSCLPEYMHILKNNPYIYKVLNYTPIMNNTLAMEGKSKWGGLFHICLQLNVLTQIHVCYHHNGLDKSVYFPR
jgi:ADP-heptose:LPS heptosyltransferase